MKDLKKVIRLSVFDFDGTLVDSPLPDSGRVKYEKVTGKPWPHKGWWGQADSLDINIFDIPTKPEVIADYQKEVSREDTMTIMLTGRMQKLSGDVSQILTHYGLKFDGYFFNRGGATDTAKLKAIEGILDQFPLIREITMWEDREEHIVIFKKWGETKIAKGELDKFEVVHVKSNNHEKDPQ